MAYLALYRKYRPQTFDDIMGQEHVTRTLQNAIKSDHVAHAYLFCGPRGTAKTTTARVLAKAMNCAHGPTPEPCDRCDACERIRDGRSLDVVEIDAASNRGIDDVKLLREQVGRASAQERYKFYIIDEVHQLSADAFQALLKTLEEPPPNVIFVLATTETHRVPKTIVSRCQRFDFRRGTLKDLTDRLRYVVDREGMAADPDALTSIARAAAGGWRDALSLLEQVAAFSSDRIDLESVNTVLGSVGEADLFLITDALASGDTAALFEAIDARMAEGKEPRQLLSALGAHLRDLLWVQSGAETAASLPPDALAQYRAQASRAPQRWLMDGLDEIHRAESQMRWVSDHRLQLELTLLKIASGSTAAAAEQAAPHETEATAPSRRPARQETASLPDSGAAEGMSGRSLKPPPTSTGSERPRREERIPEPMSAGDAEAVPAHEDSTPVSAGPEPAEPEPPAAPERAARRGTRSMVPSSSIAVEAPIPGDEAEEYVSPEDSIAIGVEELWRQVLLQVKPSVRGLLKDGVPLGIDGKVFRVGFRFRPHIDILERKDNKEQIEKALRSISKMELRVKGEPLEGAPAGNGSSGSPAASGGSEEYLSDAEFAELFGARRLPDGP